MTHKPQMYSPKLKNVSLDVSELHYQCFIWPVPRTQAIAGLIAFRGVYRRGSAGADDARFIRWRLNEFYDAEYPQRIRGLVIDLQDLDYEWGDDLTVDAPSLSKGPLLVLARAEQMDVFKGVIDTSLLRTHAEQAFAEIVDAVRATKL